MTFSTIPLLLLADLVADLPAAVRLQRLVGSLRAHFACGAVALLNAQEERELSQIIERGVAARERIAAGERISIDHATLGRPAPRCACARCTSS